MVDLESFKYSGANITGVSLIDVNSRVVAEVKSKIAESFSSNDAPYSPFYNGPQEITVCFFCMSLRIVLAPMCDDTENGWHISAQKNKQQRTHNVFCV